MERLRMERQQPQCRLGVHRIERCENFLSLFPHIFIFVLFVSSGRWPGFRQGADTTPTSIVVSSA